jgi:hypothetical protein
VWGDPDTGTVEQMGVLMTTFKGQHTPDLVTGPATMADVLDYMATWWEWASEAKRQPTRVSAFPCR